MWKPEVQNSEDRIEEKRTQNSRNQVLKNEGKKIFNHGLTQIDADS
jgi:hypothetical protein